MIKSSITVHNLLCHKGLCQKPNNMVPEKTITKNQSTLHFLLKNPEIQ